MQFTAAAVFALEQQKKLKTKDTIDKFLADVPADKRKMQLLHLLTHTSGLPPPDKSVGAEGARWRVSVREGGLVAEARTPGAFALLSGKPIGAQKHIVKQSQEIVGGLGASDFTALRALDEYQDLRWVGTA
jgi:CubicO group peptidase (beta-lactamase class C family)